MEKIYKPGRFTEMDLYLINQDNVKDAFHNKKSLEPNEHGNYPCPHCSFILTPILREWMNPPRVTDYICHRCKIGFKVKVKGSLDKITKTSKQIVLFFESNVGPGEIL